MKKNSDSSRSGGKPDAASPGARLQELDAEEVPISGPFAPTFRKGDFVLQEITDVAAEIILRLLVVISIVVMIGVGVLGFVTMAGAFFPSDGTTSTENKPANTDAGVVKGNPESINIVAPSLEGAPNDSVSISDGSDEASKIENDSEHNTVKGIKKLISGLEFLLLAPLSFLILRSLAEYIQDLRKDKKLVSEIENLIATGSTALDEAKLRELYGHSAVSPKTKSCLRDAKALTFGLLFSVLATHMVGKLLVEREGTDLALFKVEGFIGIGLLIVLGTIYYLLEKEE